ncbi:NAD(P)-dependent alcohol dehydrogenase [Burkholderia vietnamiensis]|nr:NAD(P)-dependent alcohol dehydrogenase [Burkholderia vietnamiensis]
MKARGYAAHSENSPLRIFDFERRDTRGNDVAIEILYCGVCHSDVHMTRNDWGSAIYPMVPGHEIVGRVLAIGTDVTRFNIGDLVGVGSMVDSCLSCVSCSKGLEQYCEVGATYSYNAVDPRDGLTTYGGYSDKIVVSDKFVVSIPDGLDPKRAAPLLCAGITTWSPLRHWNVGPGSKVAVIGLGGLGHMALKFSKALGAEVTLLTRSPGKDADARRFGADNVIVSTHTTQMANSVGKFDLIIDTVPYQHDVNPFIPTLAVNGTLVLVGYLGPLEPALHSAPMVLKRQTVAGSFVGGIRETQEMLDFCGTHRIECDIELIDIDHINDAYERLLRGDVKYRFVIDMASLSRMTRCS